MRIFLFVLMLLLNVAVSEAATAVFAWDGVKAEDRAVLERCQAELILLDINHTDCLPLIRDYEVALVAGSPEWGVQEMRTAAEKAIALKANGIVFDIEGDYAKLADSLEHFSSELPVYVCIPYWLDKALAERIIKASDGVLVMNYWRGSERQNMQTEIDIAKHYGKKIWSVYELQPPGAYGLKDMNTYYGLGLEAVKDNYRKEFKGTDVGLAYHHLGVM